MEIETVFSASHPWFTAEGIQDGKPTMYRGRQIPDRFVGESSLPNIYTVTISFDVADSTKLPTEMQYRMIEEFEARYIDKVETSQMGVVAFIKTFNGFVRYYLYVSNVDEVSKAFGDANSKTGGLELAAGSDPDWSEYRAFMKGVKH